MQTCTLAAVIVVLLFALPSTGATTGSIILGEPRLTPSAVAPEAAELPATSEHAPYPAQVLAPRNWMQWNITNPIARVWEAMAFDPLEGYILMFGGDVENISTLLASSNDTWEYRNQSWTELCTGTSATPQCAVSPPAGPATMTYDPASGYMLLIASDGSSWAYGSGVWRELDASGGPGICAFANECGQNAAPMAYDPNSGRVVVLSPSGYTWAFHDGVWTNLGPDVTAPYADEDVLYYDSTYQSLVYVDGSATKAYLWDGNATWSPVTLGSSSGEVPPGVSSGCASSSYMGAGAYDPTLAGIVALYYSGCSSIGTTWLLRDDNWTNVTIQVGGGPPAGNWRDMVFDDADNYSLLLDGENESAPGPVEFNQTWSLLDPLNLSMTAAPSNVEVGQNLTLRLSTVGGLRPYTSILTGLPQGCATPVNGVSELCAPTTPGNYTIRVNVTDSAIDASANASATIEVYPRLNATARASTTATTAGYPVAFSSSITGGRPPYSSLWTFGDGTSSSDQNASHNFGAPGTFEANFSITDSLGVTVSVTGISVTVNGPLVLLATANRTVVDAGMSISFTADPHVGTPPYNATWAFGDGTIVAPGFRLSHTFLQTGNFSAVATVSDAAGDTQVGSILVTVNPALTTDLTVNESSPSNGTYVTFTAAAMGGTAPYGYSWSFGDGDVGGISGTFPGESVEHRYVTVGNYTAQLVVTDALGVVRMAEVNVSVHSTATTPGTGTPSPPPFLSGETLLVVEAGAVLAFVAAAVVAVLYVRRRQRS